MKARRAPKTDANHDDIRSGLRRAGASVQDLILVGDGCPDILVGYYGHNILMEIKDPGQPRSKRKLTPDQEKWHGRWRGQRAVVHSLEEAFAVCRQVSGLGAKL